MKRTVKTLAMILLTAFSYTMPIQACWWNSYDDWFDFDDDSGYDDYGYDYYDDYSGFDDYTWDITLDEVEVTGGSSNDSFWDMGVYIERDIGMDDSGAYSYDSGLQQSSDSSPSGDTGGNNGPSFGNYSNSSNSVTVGWPPCDMEAWPRITTTQLKNLGTVHPVPNLPREFLVQYFKYECVANSIAVVAGIVDGTSPEETRKAIRDIADKAQYDLEEKGIPVGKVISLLRDYCAITEGNKFNRSVVENYMESTHKPVLAVTEVLDDKGNYLGAHMIPIVDYDSNYYYGAAGDGKVAVIPKYDFEVKDGAGEMKYRIYLYNGKKYVNK